MSIIWIIGWLFTVGAFLQLSSKDGDLNGWDAVFLIICAVVVSFFIWPVILGSDYADKTWKGNPSKKGEPER